MLGSVSTLHRWAILWVVCFFGLACLVYERVNVGLGTHVTRVVLCCFLASLEPFYFG